MARYPPQLAKTHACTHSLVQAAPLTLQPDKQMATPYTWKCRLCCIWWTVSCLRWNQVAVDATVTSRPSEMMGEHVCDGDGPDRKPHIVHCSVLPVIYIYRSFTAVIMSASCLGSKPTKERWTKAPKTMMRRTLPSTENPAPPAGTTWQSDDGEKGRHPWQRLVVQKTLATRTNRKTAYYGLS